MRRALLALLLLAGCEDPVQTLDPPQPIEADPRCTAAEILSMGRPMRVDRIDGDRLAIWGYDDTGRQYNGRILTAPIDRSAAPTELWIDFPINTLHRHQGAWFTAGREPNITRLAPDGTDELVINFRPTAAYGTVRDLFFTRNGDVIFAFEYPYPKIGTQLARVGPGDALRWTGGLRDDSDQPLFPGELRGIALTPGGDIVTTGLSVDAFDGERIAYIEWLDGTTGRSFARQFFTQRELEPMRIVLDRSGEPFLLALEGHSGDRYQNGQPYIARIDRDAHLADRVDIPLPEGTQHGALLAAVDLDDGWLLGGSACGRGRSWCEAWIHRTRGDETAWSRRLLRSVAATVNDLEVIGDHVVAIIASSRYCCEFNDFDHDGWVWELSLDDGDCDVDPLFPLDGSLLR
ncbi:MAG: hypothetical protein R3F65_13170 [bacterium]|nr:hypothetical protein [Myxococcales bacterium]MCB9543517.1 hypothetical protein [Myxococcales bacterium]MCB9553926.1 hypothetical protein [Myxococcales bacterium]